MYWKYFGSQSLGDNNFIHVKMHCIVISWIHWNWVGTGTGSIFLCALCNFLRNYRWSLQADSQICNYWNIIKKSNSSGRKIYLNFGFLEISINKSKVVISKILPKSSWLEKMNYTKVLFSIASPTHACLIIILNIPVVAFICKMKMVDRKKSTVFILNLAISDLFLGFMILFVKILYMIKDNRGDDNGDFFPLFCTFMRRSVIQITLMASVLTNNILTTERFLAVKHPYVYNRITKVQRRNACFLVWFISIAIVLCFYFADPHDLLQRYHE